MNATQASFGQVGRNQEVMSKTKWALSKSQDTISKITKASIKILEMEIGQLSRQIVSQPTSSGVFVGNTVDNHKKWELQCHWVERHSSFHSKRS